MSEPVQTSDYEALADAPWADVDAYIGGSFDRCTLALIVSARERRIRAEAWADGIRAAQQVVAGENDIEWARHAYRSMVSVADVVTDLDQILRDEQGHSA